MGTISRADLRTVAQRFHLVIGLAAVVGAVTGLLVAGFDAFVRDVLFAAVTDSPLGLAAVAPVAGLVLTVVVMRRWSPTDALTTDAYVRAYHERGGELLARRLPAKLAACAATLGSGGAMGYEGPAILIGGTVGSWGERNLGRRLRQDDAKVLMVAGAAAGVAAVFKAPLTGIVFALEVPYHQDLARRALLPALVSASAAYLVFVALLGTEPVLRTGGAAPFNLPDLAGGLGLGLACGALARVGAWAIGHAKHLHAPIALRVAVGGALLAVGAVVTHHLFDAPLTLGSGYAAIDWAGAHPAATGLLVALFVLRFAATWVTVAGGGVGGLFIPLVTQGALAGAVTQSVVHASNPGLFPTVGIAAFLGAGYRTPLAGVAFVAEATGQPGFVVPALLAAAASQLAIGRWSFSPYQRDQRRPDITPLAQLTLGEVMSPNADTVAASATVDEALAHLLPHQRRWAPVVDGTAYVGLVSVADLAAVPAERRADVRARDVARAEVPVLAVGDAVLVAGRTLRDLDAGAAAVADATGMIVGVVTARDITTVEKLLDRMSPDR